jgi:hypothetical protein
MNAIGKLMLTMNRTTKSSENAVKPEVFDKLSLLLLLLFLGGGVILFGGELTIYSGMSGVGLTGSKARISKPRLKMYESLSCSVKKVTHSKVSS